jgi:hypothetical protein
MPDLGRLLRNFVGIFGVIGFGAGVGGSLTGCSVSATVDPCSTIKEGVFPTAAVADHTAAAPGNQVSFYVGYPNFPAGCAVPAIVLNPSEFTWISSDPVNAPISNAMKTAGIATCMGATTVPATISIQPGISPATFNPESATLTCK